jgi:hypothetical protein
MVRCGFFSLVNDDAVLLVLEVDIQLLLRLLDHVFLNDQPTHVQLLNVVCNNEVTSNNYHFVDLGRNVSLGRPVEGFYFIRQKAILVFKSLGFSLQLKVVADDQDGKHCKSSYKKVDKGNRIDEYEVNEYLPLHYVFGVVAERFRHPSLVSADSSNRVYE